MVPRQQEVLSATELCTLKRPKWPAYRVHFATIKKKKRIESCLKGRGIQIGQKEYDYLCLRGILFKHGDATVR